MTMVGDENEDEIIEAIVDALARACPERAMAGWGKRFRIAIKGEDPRQIGSQDFNFILSKEIWNKQISVLFETLYLSLSPFHFLVSP